MDDKNCPSCGGPVQSGASFCRNCGHDLDGESKNCISRKNGWLAIVLAIAVFGAFYLVLMAEKGPGRQADMHQHGQDMAAMSDDQMGMISQLPVDYDSLVQMGNGFMDDGIYQMAITCYTRALAIDSTDPNVLTDLGVCYHASNDPEKAVSVFEQAIRIDPDHMITYFNLGVVCGEMNQPEKMKFYWNKLIEKFPGTPMADSVRSYLKRL
nr:tetratricopeptide repeat protein [candidate division Zixibacteria bacterium]